MAVVRFRHDKPGLRHMAAVANDAGETRIAKELARALMRPGLGVELTTVEVQRLAELNHTQRNAEVLAPRVAEAIALEEYDAERRHNVLIRNEETRRANRFYA